MRTILTNREVAAIKREYSSRVKVTCDEAHVHTALDGCLDSAQHDPRDIAILKLCETIENERHLVDRMMASFLAAKE